MGLKFENYSKVFNSDNTIKLCGREACKVLIEEANTLEPNISHGNLETGYMNIEKIQRLYSRLKEG